MAKETENVKVDSDNLDAMKAEMEAMKAQMLADAKAEAEKIVAEAKASVKGKKTDAQKKADEKEKEHYNELVEIELFKDNGKYKDDVFVAVNGVGCIIPRGVKVKVKRKYALAIEDSMKQDRKTSDFIELKVRELDEAEKNI